MKLFILLSFFITHFVFGQGNWADKTFYINCKTERIKWTIFNFESKKYSYSLIEKSYEHTENNIDYFTGTVLLNFPNQKIDDKTLKLVLSIISKKINLNKFTVFKTCEAHKIYISAMGPKNLIENLKLKTDFVGYFDNQKLMRSNF